MSTLNGNIRDLSSFFKRAETNEVLLVEVSVVNVNQVVLLGLAVPIVRVEPFGLLGVHSGVQLEHDKHSAVHSREASLRCFIFHVTLIVKIGEEVRFPQVAIVMVGVTEVVGGANVVLDDVKVDEFASNAVNFGAEGAVTDASGNVHHAHVRSTN